MTGARPARGPVARRALLALGVLALALGGAAAWFFTVTTPRVAEVIRAEPDGATARETLLLTLPEGRTIPVNYLHEDGVVYLGSDFGWWKAFVGDGAPVELLMRGVSRRGRAHAVLDDPGRRDEIFARLRPTAPAWLPEPLLGKLVVVTLDDP